ncbi:unnamed protein product [Ilex paraguariensis]|uniref:Uncharacterized protein n=1 Tax=Ilex paraguariensis TaxID=185542 RepID=A0ABC8TC81_9AQUA
MVRVSEDSSVSVDVIPWFDLAPLDSITEKPHFSFSLCFVSSALVYETKWLWLCLDGAWTLHFSFSDAIELFRFLALHPRNVPPQTGNPRPRRRVKVEKLTA